MKVVADEHVVGAQPEDQFIVGGLEAGIGPEALLAVTADGQGVEAPIAAELKIEEEEGQKLSLRVGRVTLPRFPGPLC